MSSTDGIDLTPKQLQREEIMPWIEAAQAARLNADVLGRLMPPREGSFLRPTPEDPLKNMACWCHSFLEAAADHLVLWADHVAPLKFHPEAETVHTFRPAFTLARATIESAAQAIWVLSPEEPSLCGTRYIKLATWDLVEQTKAAATPESRAELQARRDEILARLGVTAQTFRPPTYLDVIRSAAEFLSLGDIASTITPDRVERLWRSAAGAAHGKQWPEFEYNDRTPVGEGLSITTPKIEAISDALEVASRFLSAGVILFAMRAGYWDEFSDIWDDAVTRLATRMTTVSGEPLRPEDIPDFRAKPGD